MYLNSSVITFFVGVLYRLSSMTGFLATVGGTFRLSNLVVVSVVVVVVVLDGDLVPDETGTPTYKEEQW